MADFAQSSTNGGAGRFLNRPNPKFQGFQSPVTRYGFAVVCVAIAAGLALAIPGCAFNALVQTGDAGLTDFLTRLRCRACGSRSFGLIGHMANTGPAWAKREETE